MVSLVYVLCKGVMWEDGGRSAYTGLSVLERHSGSLFQKITSLLIDSETQVLALYSTGSFTLIIHG